MFQTIGDHRDVHRGAHHGVHARDGVVLRAENGRNTN